MERKINPFFFEKKKQETFNFGQLYNLLSLRGSSAAGLRSSTQLNDVAILAFSLPLSEVSSGLPRCQAGFCQGKITACLPRNDRNQKQHPNTKVLCPTFFQKSWGFERNIKPFFS
ncbi:MAG: hypothetical protein Q4B50_04805 [Bacillota bacterium]|nr:hypothetical protein [Bacillota bacterium]